MFYFDFSQKDFVEGSFGKNYFDLLADYKGGFTNTNFFLSSDNMTDNSNINELNKEYIEKLNLKNDYFINLLLHTDFEDGIENPAIIYVETNMNNNIFATYLWLSNLYNAYSFIQDFDKKRNAILLGILRIFSYISGYSYLKCIEPTLLGLVKIALLDENLAVKEAGIMVIEELRDEDSLKLLESIDFSNTVLEKYARKVIEELKNELNATNKVA